MTNTDLIATLESAAFDTEVNVASSLTTALAVVAAHAAIAEARRTWDPERALAVARAVARWATEPVARAWAHPRDAALVGGVYLLWVEEQCVPPAHAIPREASWAYAYAAALRVAARE